MDNKKLAFMPTYPRQSFSTFTTPYKVPSGHLEFITYPGVSQRPQAQIIHWKDSAFLFFTMIGYNIRILLNDRELG